jgi:hypothetical protein
MAIDQSGEATAVLNSLCERNVVGRVPSGLKRQVMPGERREPYQERCHPYQKEPRRLLFGLH